MRRTCVGAAALVALAGCDSKTPTAPTGTANEPVPQPAPQVAEVTVSGDARFTSLNQVHSFTATARLADGVLRDVTAEAQWSSSDPDVATVSSGGGVTSVAIGVATISAHYYRTRAVNVSVAPVGQLGISGLYRLGFTASPGCSSLPDWAKHREYEAIVDQSEEMPNGYAGFLLTVHVQRGFTPVFSGSIKGSHVTLWLPTDDPYSYTGDGDPVFSEVIDDTHMYTVHGNATGTKSGSRDVEIAGRLSGFIRVVDLRTRAPTFECYSEGHQLSLVRQ